MVPHNVLGISQHRFLRVESKWIQTDPAIGGVFLFCLDEDLDVFDRSGGDRHCFLCDVGAAEVRVWGKV